MRVLIAGAGPTGLTAAVELARRGVIADIIDKRDAASGFSRAVGITPLSLRLLEPSGVTGKLLSEGICLDSLEVYAADRHRMHVPLPPPEGPLDVFVALAQDRTETALHDALKKYGGQVRYGVAFESLEQNADTVAVTTSEGTDRYDCVLGADGVRSAVRASLGIPFDGFDLPGTWSIADVDVAGWRHPKSLTGSLLAGGNIAVVVPLEEQRFRVISSMENCLESLPLPLDVTNIRRQGKFGISIRQVPEYRNGRVYLAGDSAHCHSPAGGRGMNLGIADAVEFAERVADNTLDGYSAHRHHQGAETIRFSERIRGVVMSSTPVGRAIRSVFLPLVNATPFLQRRAADQFMNG